MKSLGFDKAGRRGSPRWRRRGDVTLFSDDLTFRRSDVTVAVQPPDR